MSVLMAKRKKPRNVDRHKKPRLAFHLEQELLDAFREYVEGLSPKPGESEVLRLALRQYLRGVGAWPPKPPEPPGQSSPDAKPS